MQVTKPRSWFSRFAKQSSRMAGKPIAFLLATAVVVLWLATGPLFGFSDTWQLVINTGTTIVTFLMVFLIQRSQNKDAQAVHLKLNELVAALEGASSRLINVEDLTEEEVRTLHQHYEGLVTLAKRENSLTHSHSIEEAEARHRRKARGGRASLMVTPPVSGGPTAVAS
jgi:low affinity Fe/Cu permease